MERRINLKQPDICIRTKIGNCGGCPLAAEAVQRIQQGQEQQKVVADISRLCPDPTAQLVLPVINRRRTISL